MSIIDGARIANEPLVSSGTRSAPMSMHRKPLWCAAHATRSRYEEWIPIPRSNGCPVRGCSLLCRTVDSAIGGVAGAGTTGTHCSELAAGSAPPSTPSDSPSFGEPPKPPSAM